MQNNIKISLQNWHLSYSTRCMTVPLGHLLCLHFFGAFSNMLLKVQTSVSGLDPHYGSALWILIMDPHYGSALRIRIKDLHYGSALWIRIMDPHYGSALRIRITDPHYRSALPIRITDPHYGPRRLKNRFLTRCQD